MLAKNNKKGGKDEEVGEVEQKKKYKKWKKKKKKNEKEKEKERSGEPARVRGPPATDRIPSQDPRTPVFQRHIAYCKKKGPENL